MNFKLPAKKITVISIVIILAGLILAALIFAYLRGVFFNSPLARTAQGIIFEDLLPPDTSFVFSYNPSDAPGREKIAAVWQTVFQNKEDAVVPFIIDTLLNSEATAKSVTDLKKLFGKDFRFLVAFSGLGPQIQKPDIYIFASTQDPESAKNYFTEHSGDNVRRTIAGKKYFIAFGQPFNFGTVGDVLFFTNANERKTQDIVRRYQNNFFQRLINPSLTNAVNFRKALNRTPKPFAGYLFAKMQATNDALDTVKFMAGSWRASENGLAFDSFAPIKKNALSKSPFAPLFSPFTLSLYKKIPGGNALLFASAHHFGNIVMAEIEVMKTSFGISDSKNIYEKLRIFSGFDFQNDLLPFLNKDMAISLQDSGTVLPSFSLFIDASEAPEKARNVIQKLTEAVPAWIATTNMSLKSKRNNPILEEKNFAGATFGKIIQFSPDKIPTDIANIPLLQKMTEPMEISYGLTQQNVFFISTARNIEEAFSSSRSIENNSLFADVGGTENLASFLLVDARTLTAYLNRLNELTQTAAAAAEETGFAVFLKYLQKIDGFVQGSRADSQNVYGNGLLKIQIQN